MRKDKSMLDVAFEVVETNKSPLGFRSLLDQVAIILEMSEEEKLARLGAFYTDLSLDGRFVVLTDNTWDLRIRHTYDKVHIDVNEVYSESTEGEELLDPEETDEEERDEDYAFEGEEKRETKVDLEGTGIREEDL